MRTPRHPSLTDDLLLEAIESRMTELDDPGFCRACGTEHSTCEPDARGYECESCGALAVDSPEVILGLI